VKKVIKEWVLKFNKCSQAALKEVELKLDSLFISNNLGIFSDEEASSLKSLLALRQIYRPNRKPPGV
jgi:hypothetical protein